MTIQEILYAVYSRVCFPGWDDHARFLIYGNTKSLPPDVRAAVVAQQEEIDRYLNDWFDRRKSKLQSFIDSAGIMRIWSDHLGESVLLAGKWADVDAYRKRNNNYLDVCYQGDELRTLVGCRKEQIALIHEVKASYPGAQAMVDDTADMGGVQNRRLFEDSIDNDIRSIAA